MFSDTFWAVLRKSNVWILSPQIHWICASLYILPRLWAQDDTVSSSDSAHVMLWTDTVRSFHRLCGSTVTKGFRIRNYTLSSVRQKLQSLQESQFSLQRDFSLSWVVQDSDLGWSWKNVGKQGLVGKQGHTSPLPPFIIFILIHLNCDYSTKAYSCFCIHWKNLQPTHESQKLNNGKENKAK